MEGWIKLHRQLLEWEWYDEPNTFRLFMHCLLKANHKDNNYRGQIVKAGSFLTSRELLAQETGLTVQQVRTSLKRLESTSEITSKKSKKGTVLQIVKYVQYQHSNQELTRDLTINQPTANQQLTSNNNDNNDNNENKISSVLKKFDETSFTNTEERFKTSKEKIRERLVEFLEVESLNDKFKNKQTGEILKHFRNWLTYNPPHEVKLTTYKEPSWVTYAKKHNKNG